MTHLVLIIISHKPTREHLAQHLRQHGLVTVAEGSLPDAMSSLHILRPDVVVSETELPASELPRALATVPILIYSRHDILEISHTDPGRVFRDPMEEDRLLKVIREICRPLPRIT